MSKNNIKKVDTEKVEMLKLYYIEFQIRHKNYWNLFFKFSFAHLVFLSLPFLLFKSYFEIYTQIKIYIPCIILIFGSVITVFISWLLFEEYKRLKGVMNKIENLTRNDLKKEKVSGKFIGIIVSILYFITFIIITLLSTFFLLKV